ncbi:hypothetical protein BMW23_0500 [Bodo saltans virus]|uniref:Uncharacterized protein n=1 Tax=Bodo saltans virus TaxID=2024608 RepID=A0A2H4UUG1_9VIRU|nr:hypothetical protein QJ851_gp0485 [Bodo saltans virus]ATZ80548.1 hypothetical protein BMW23_0500 [Bodo saltans virus]
MDRFFALVYLFDLMSVDMYKNVFYKVGHNTELIASELVLEFWQYHINKGNIVDDDVMVSSNIAYLKAITDGLNTKNEKKIDAIKKNMDDVLDVINNTPGDDKYAKYAQFGGSRQFLNDVLVFCMPIGIYYNKKQDIDILIDITIKTIDYFKSDNICEILTGISSAYFASLSVQKVDIVEWGKMLLELLDSDKIKKKLKLDNSDNMVMYIDYMRMWNRYMESKFDGGKIKKTYSDDSIVYKIKYYRQIIGKNTNLQLLFIEYGSIIMGYDILLDCGNNYDKMIFYSVCFPSHTVSVAGFVGGIYALNNDVSEDKYEILKKRKIKINL